MPVYPELVGVLGRLRWIWIARYIPASYLYQKAMSWKAKYSPFQRGSKPPRF